MADVLISAMLDSDAGLLRAKLFKGARLLKSSTQAISATTATAVTWNSADFDVGTWWSSGASTRITVPSGFNITRIELVFQAGWVSTTHQRDITLRKNGVNSFIYGYTQWPALTGPALVQVSSGPLAVVAGDYFEAIAFDASGATTFDNASAFFSVKALG